MASSGNTAMPDIRGVLDPLSVDRGVKADAWDAWHSSSTPEQFRSTFDSLPLPKEAKAALWDLKFASTGAASALPNPDLRTAPASPGAAPPAAARTQTAVARDPTERTFQKGVLDTVTGRAEFDPKEADLFGGLVPPPVHVKAPLAGPPPIRIPSPVPGRSMSPQRSGDLIATGPGEQIAPVRPTGPPTADLTTTEGQNAMRSAWTVLEPLAISPEAKDQAFVDYHSAQNTDDLKRRMAAARLPAQVQQQLLTLYSGKQLPPIGPPGVPAAQPVKPTGPPGVPAHGLLAPGNIDLKNRPVVKNPDGSISTVRSMSFEENGKEILVPTVSDDGRILTDQQAIDVYRKTGKHLGIFDNPDNATAYAQQLHQDQASLYALKPSLLDRVKEVAMTPLATGWATGPYDALTEPFRTTRGDKDNALAGAIDYATKVLVETGRLPAEALEFTFSPVGAATLGMSLLRKGVQIAVSLGFSAATAPEAWHAYETATADPTPENVAGATKAIFLTVAPLAHGTSEIAGRMPAKSGAKPAGPTGPPPPPVAPVSPEQAARDRLKSRGVGPTGPPPPPPPPTPNPIPSRGKVDAAALTEQPFHNNEALAEMLKTETGPRRVELERTAAARGMEVPTPEPRRPQRFAAEVADAFAQPTPAERAFAADEEYRQLFDRAEQSMADKVRGRGPNREARRAAVGPPEIGTDSVLEDAALRLTKKPYAELSPKDQAALRALRDEGHLPITAQPGDEPLVTGPPPVAPEPPAVVTGPPGTQTPQPANSAPGGPPPLPKKMAESPGQGIIDGINRDIVRAEAVGDLATAERYRQQLSGVREKPSQPETGSQQVETPPPVRFSPQGKTGATVARKPQVSPHPNARASFQDDGSVVAGEVSKANGVAGAVPPSTRATTVAAAPSPAPRPNLTQVPPVRSPREPIYPVVRGANTRIPVPGENRSFEAGYAVRELSDLQPSHNAYTFERNPQYSHRNERNYAKPQNAARIDRQTREFDPAFLVSDNPDATNGPPVVDASGNVLGGNSRTMTLQRVYRDHPEAATRYREALAAKGAQFGVDSDAVRQMREPVLVREIADPKLDPQTAISDLNKVGTAALSQSERALSDSRRLSEKTLEYLESKIAEQGPDGTLAKAIEGPRGSEIVNRLAEDGIIPEQEKPRYIDSRGVLTPEGRNRIGKLMLGRVFRDPEQFELAPPELRNKLERAAAPLVRTATRPEWDLSNATREAVDVLIEAKTRGVKNLSDLEAQTAMFPTKEYSPEAMAIARKLQEGPLKVAEAFRQYANDEHLSRPGQSSTFFEPPTREQAFESAFGPAKSTPTASAAETASAEAAAWARIQQRGNLQPGRAGDLWSETRGSGLPPEDIQDLAIIGREKIKSGARELAAWSKEMVSEFGEGIRPHLELIYRESREQKDETLAPAGTLPSRASAASAPRAGRSMSLSSPEAAKANYSDLGAMKDIYVRNLSQLEKANPEAHAAALRLAGSRGQTGVIIRHAMPAIERDLRGGPSPEEFRTALIESRLRGIRQRWSDLASNIERASDQQLRQDFENGGLANLLQHIEGKRGIPQDAAQTAAALLESGKVSEFRAFVAETLRDASGEVARAMPAEQFQRLTADAKFQKALSTYKESVERPIAENHELNEGVFSDALGPLNTYYPLLPAEGNKPIGGQGRKTPYRAPKNVANQFATGLAESYDTHVAALSDRLNGAVRANNKAALLDTLEQQGLLRRLKPGERAPDTIVFGGENYEAMRVEVRPDRIVSKDGQSNYVPAQSAVIPKWLAKELQPLLDQRDIHTGGGRIRRVIDAINGFSLIGPMDLVMHSANLLGTLVANTPFVGRSVVGKTVGNLPFTKLFTVVGRIAATDPMTAASAADLAEMAKLGLIPSRHATETYSKEFARQTGAERSMIDIGPISIPKNTGPLLYGPKGIDIRARLALYQIAKEINPKGTPQQYFRFVGQLGNYISDLQGSIERSVKSSGVAPFYTAGSTMFRNGINAWLGTSPLPKGDALGARLATQLSGGAAGLVALWAITQQAYTGKWPWEDPKSRLLQIPLNPEDRDSAVGRALWGNDKSKTAYVNFAFFSPLVVRGAGALGLSGAYNATQAGASPGQAIEEAERGTVNAVLSPFTTGPLPRAAFLAVTGAEPYVTSLRDDRGQFRPQFMTAIAKAPPGLPTIAERAAETTLALNPFVRGVAAATGFGHEAEREEQRRGDAWLRMITSLTVPRLIGQALDPTLRATRFAEQRVQQSEHSQASGQIARKVRSGQDARQDAENAVSKGVLSPREAVALLGKRSQQTPLEFSIGRLPADEALKVYERATDEEKRRTQKLVESKLERTNRDGTMSAETRSRATSLGLAVRGGPPLPPEDRTQQFRSYSELAPFGARAQEEREARHRRAREIYDQIVSTPAADRETFVSELQLDPPTIRAINALIDAENLAGFEKSLRSSPVTTRAEYIRKKLAATPPEEIETFLQGLIAKKILTPAVVDRLNELNAGPPPVPVRPAVTPTGPPLN